MLFKEIGSGIPLNNQLLPKLIFKVPGRPSATGDPPSLGLGIMLPTSLLPVKDKSWFGPGDPEGPKEGSHVRAPPPDRGRGVAVRLTASRPSSRLRILHRPVKLMPHHGLTNQPSHRLIIKQKKGESYGNDKAEAGGSKEHPEGPGRPKKPLTIRSDGPCRTLGKLEPVCCLRMGSVGACHNRRFLLNCAPWRMGFSIWSAGRRW